MRERLIELIEDAYFCNIEELADYLLANGIIVPPCKVGDKVWYVPYQAYVKGIIELTVENIVVGINPSKCKLYCEYKNGHKDLFYQDSFGRCLFFTFEEAEAALKGGAE